MIIMSYFKIVNSVNRTTGVTRVTATIELTRYY